MTYFLLFLSITSFKFQRMHIFFFVAHFVEAFPLCPQQATETTNYWIGGRGCSGGMGVGGEVMVEPHRHEGAFIAKGEEDGSWWDCIIRRKSVQVSLFFFYCYLHSWKCIFCVDRRVLFFYCIKFLFLVWWICCVVYIIYVFILLNHSFLLRMKMELKQSTGSGTPSDINWQLPFLVVLMMFGLKVSFTRLLPVLLEENRGSPILSPAI